MKKPKLTVSILISNNYDNVKRCLEAIKPLIESVDSELILTDTGCSKKVRNLIKQYSDHIIDFEWIKDFSAARNAGVKEARGEWFLYVDDDEYFDDLSEMIDFFNSDECDKYNVAAYVQRNYLDWDGSVYVDHNVDRIIRITPEFHFEHRVHEAYMGVKIGEKKKLSTFVHHYGYIYKSEEENWAKHNRNEELLLKEIEDYPNDMRMRHQLVRNYLPVKKYDESIEASFEAIKIESDSEYWDAIHTNILYCYELKKDWDSVIKYGEEFLNKRLYPYDTFGVYQFLINAYWNKGEYKKVCQMTQTVMRIYKDYKRNPDKYNLNQLLREEFWDVEHVSKMLLEILSCVLHENDYNTIKAFRNEDIRSEIMFLVQDEKAKESLMCIVFESIDEGSKIELFEQLPFSKGIWDTSLDMFEKQMETILPFIESEKFVLWEEWILDHVAEGSAKEMCAFAKICDYKLRNVDYYTTNDESMGSVEFVLSMLSGYAETELYLCEEKYGEKLQQMAEEDLLSHEKIAWDIQKMMSDFEKNDLGSVVRAVKGMLDIYPQWAKALGKITDYIQQLLGGK